MKPMLRYCVKRLAFSAVSLVMVVTLTFFLMSSLPGDPFMSEKATEENRALLTAKYGLDQPVCVQYLRYLENLLRGDLGTSYVVQRGRAVSEIIRESFSVSLRIGIAALVLAVAAGLLLGCAAGLCRGGWADKVIRVLTAAGVSLPGYVLANILLLVLAVRLRLLPVTFHQEGGMVMPVLTLAVYPACSLTRLVRTGILETWDQDYLRTARAKGASEGRVICVHALRNALVPVISWTVPLCSFLLTGGFVAESVFNVPGLGRYFVTSVSSRDYTMIMGITVFYAALVIVVNLVGDILYRIADPRITLE